MELELLLVRHLPTEWNETGRLQGRADLPIARSAEFDSEVLQRIQGFGPDVSWCSTLRRSRDSARAAGVRDYRESALLDELDFGPFQGVPKEVLMRETEGRWHSRPFSTPLGPALLDLEKRVGAFLELCVATGSRHLVFGHGAWIRLAVMTVRGLDRDRMNTLEIPPGAAVDVGWGR